MRVPKTSDLGHRDGHCGGGWVVGSEPERERERERALLGTTVHNGGSRGGVRSTDSASPRHRQETLGLAGRERERERESFIRNNSP